MSGVVKGLKSDGSILISGTPEYPQLSVNPNADLFGVDAIFDDPVVLFDDVVVLFDGIGAFSVAAHSHAIADVSGLQAALDAKTDESVVPSTAPSAGQILVGNAGGTAYEPKTTSGDVTIASTGVTTIGAGKVTEAMQVLADNTTNNASTSAHGYLKKLSNVSTEYMDGTGAWSTPAGGGGSGDTYFPWVRSLLHFNGSDASTTFTDVIGHTWTASGNAQLDTAKSKFGSASALFDGTGDYVTCTTTDLLSSTRWTVEFWVWFNALAVATEYTVYGQYNGAQAARTLMGASNKLMRIFNGSTGSATGATTLVTGQWYHMRFVRDNTICRGYLDGVLELTHTNFQTPFAGEPRLGAYLSAGSPTGGLDGWIDDFRITEIRRNIGNFTAPTSEFSDS